MSDQPNVQQAVPFFGVTAMPESLAFYVDGLGFTLTQHWSPEGSIRWCWLQLEGAAVMLQEYVANQHGPGRPAGTLGLGVSICFICRDALALYHAFRERGVAASRPFVGNAMWVTNVTDPDGYQLCFESPTDSPEETVYQECSPAERSTP
ncbi:MAG: VOC family protein [Fimbriimonadaceae bacterium]|nr:VOC family protein [Fimbriimonadaceae bacterium]